MADWQQFQRYNGSTTEYYGLWAYCQEQSPFFSSICKRWPDAADQLFNGSIPIFVKTSEGLITTSMILLSLGLIAGVIAAILPILSYVAAVLIFLAFLFLIIGLPIFGNESNSFSRARGDASYSKRYGFWLMVPTIILAFLSSILFGVAGFLYQKFGFGNIATPASPPNNEAGGGNRRLGPPNILAGLPYANVPGFYANPYAYGPRYGFRQPSLLSQYIAQRIPRSYGPVAPSRMPVAVLPQSSAAHAVLAAPAYVVPSYRRTPVAIPASSAPIINLTGQTLVGPLIQRA